MQVFQDPSIYISRGLKFKYSNTCTRSSEKENVIKMFFLSFSAKTYVTHSCGNSKEQYQIDGPL